jgi:CcmD family protein
MSYLFAAFCAVWIVVFLYLLSLSRRHRALSREVEALRKVMEQKGSLQSSETSPRLSRK